MANWHDGEVEANGIRLHYARNSAANEHGRPSVVLAHGFSDNGRCWMPVAEQLADDYDVIMVDARGHGRSDAPESGYSAVDHAADLRDLIAALELHRPAVLGHSMGAMSTLVLAGSYPDVPGAILLEDPPARWISAADAGPGDAAWRARTRTWIEGLKQQTREQMIAAERKTNPGWSDAELEPWAEAKEQLSLNVLNREFDSHFDVRSIVQHVSCPALLIVGDTARGAIVGAEAAAELQVLVPQLRVAEIAGAGHSIRRDSFEPYMQAVRGFLAEWAVA